MQHVLPQRGKVLRMLSQLLPLEQREVAVPSLEPAVAWKANDFVLEAVGRGRIDWLWTLKGAADVSSSCRDLTRSRLLQTESQGIKKENAGQPLHQQTAAQVHRKTGRRSTKEEPGRAQGKMWRNTDKELTRKRSKDRTHTDGQDSEDMRGSWEDRGGKVAD